MNGASEITYARCRAAQDAYLDALADIAEQCCSRDELSAIPKEGLSHFCQRHGSESQMRKAKPEVIGFALLLLAQIPSSI